MNQPKSAFTEDDDDIGVLIYQHAKREVENSAAALSQETDRTHRRSARITRTVALTKAASHATVQSQKPVRIARSTNPIKSKPYKLNATDSKAGSSWLARYSELVKYKQEFGSCDVPKRYKPNPQLGEWVVNQRQRFKNKSLSEEHINKLNQIGFVWTIYEDAWLARYNELLEYKCTFGDFNVPKRYNGERSLANWVCQQRVSFKNKTLSESRIAKLNEVGFTWSKEGVWMKRCSQFVEYKREFGDCCVNLMHKLNPQLGRWVHKQRYRFKNKQLSEDRIAKLNEIGFAWEVKRKK
jgi:hypothetical protein